jgi:mannose-6-phosphate isomerase-like protein (cupin superfamily)
VKVSAGEARWRPDAVTHSIQNIGKTRFEAVDIELK